MQARFFGHLDRILFGLGLLVLVFAYGYGAGRWDWPPAGPISRALDAAKDWRDNWRHYLHIRSKYLAERPRQRGGVTVWDRQRAFAGYTFVTAFTGERFEALLLDMDGTVAHRWRVSPPEVWPDARHVDVVPDDWEASYHGALMTPEGDVFISVGGAGTVRLDRCSRVVWQVPRRTHHDIDLLPNGELLIASQEVVREMRPERPRIGPGPDGYYYDETILRVAPDGTIVEEFSLIDAILASNRFELLVSGPGPSASLRANDPLHNNTVEMLRPDMAGAFPLFEAGDIMVSMRNINTIAVLDGRSKHIKWSLTGPFLGQHDPDFLPNGHILLYDNRITGKSPTFGNTRLLEIDPLTHRIVWEWEGKNEFAFYNESRGEAAPLPNGNVLAVDSHGGRVFEVERGSGDVVWEWVNLAEPGWVMMVVDAERYPPEEVRFLGQPCPGGGPSASSALRPSAAKAHS